MSGFLVPGEFVCKDFVSYQNEHQSRVTTSIHLHPDIASEPPRLPQHHAKPRAVTGGLYAAQMTLSGSCSTTAH